MCQRLGAVLTLAWLMIMPIYSGLVSEHWSFLKIWALALVLYSITAVIVWGLAYLLIYAVRWVLAGRNPN